jgi:Flp pilus assembly protein TadG
MLPSHAVDRPAAETGAVRAAAGRGERGAVLVHAAVAITGLLAFSALTVDLGSMWVIRAQAQNAADAAALAGTVSLAYVNPTDMEAARAASRAIVAAHRVWGETVAPSAVVVTTETCPAGSPAVTGHCVNVTVGLGAAHGTPLPTFFARLVGGTATNVRASASGKVLTGNSTTCLRPLAIPDAWHDRVDTPNDGAWTDTELDTDHFDGYDAEGSAADDTDYYRPPDAGTPGTGITVASMVGHRIVRRIYNPVSGLPIPANALLAFDLSRPGMEGNLDQETLNRYSANLETCPGVPMAIGASVSSFEVHRSAYTVDPLRQLIDSDGSAYWDVARGQVVSALGVSPRIITIGVADPQAFSQQRRVAPEDESATLPTVPLRLTNLVGFFVESVRDGALGYGEVTGVIVPVPGRFDQSAPLITADAAFLRSVALVR